MGFPRGILVLKAQSRLSGILRAIVERLLEGSGETKEPGTLSQALGLGLRKQITTSNVEFASVFINQPFSSPPAFDVKALLAIAQAQANFYGDHLEILQTDPRSLREYASQVMAGEPDETSLRYRHAGAALKLMEDAMDFWKWDWILQEIHSIQDLHTRYQGQPSTNYQQSIGRLKHSY